MMSRPRPRSVGRGEDDGIDSLRGARKGLAMSFDPNHATSSEDDDDGDGKPRHPVGGSSGRTGSSAFAASGGGGGSGKQGAGLGAQVFLGTHTVKLMKRRAKLEEVVGKGTAVSGNIFKDQKVKPKSTPAVAAPSGVTMAGPHHGGGKKGKKNANSTIVWGLPQYPGMPPYLPQMVPPYPPQMMVVNNGNKRKGKHPDQLKKLSMKILKLMRNNLVAEGVALATPLVDFIARGRMDGFFPLVTETNEKGESKQVAISGLIKTLASHLNGDHKQFKENLDNALRATGMRVRSRRGNVEKYGDYFFRHGFSQGQEKRATYLFNASALIFSIVKYVNTRIRDDVKVKSEYWTDFDVQAHEFITVMKNAQHVIRTINEQTVAREPKSARVSVAGSTRGAAAEDEFSDEEEATL